MRACGILLPVASLPSKYGIGSFSKEAYQFIDRLAKAGQKYWQILPLGPTGYGDSPYQSFSTFAGNPYFIDLEQFVEMGLLKSEECDSCDFGSNDRKIDYGKIYDGRYPLLKLAFQRDKQNIDEKFCAFRRKHRDWLEAYGLYMAVKDLYDGKSWNEWPEAVRMHHKEQVEQLKVKLESRITYYAWLQYRFYEQWDRLKMYANQKGIKIIGDLPIYVAFDSADTWNNPELFQFNDHNEPLNVAGCPPDSFSEDGQLWGNPLYKWEYHKQSGYSWWIRRIRHSLTLYDIVRIDHFRGFDEYYSIPYGETTARNGHWEAGPGLEFFDVVKAEIIDLPLIAEDLGYLTPSVTRLVKDTGFPGMKIIEFAFDSREAGDYMPYTYHQNSVVYTGTHDNQTLQGWLDEMSAEDRALCDAYLDLYDKDPKNIYWDFIRLALGSVADTAIIPLQDYLGLGAAARLNTPSTLGTNWQWRMKSDDFTENLGKKIHMLAKTYGRL